MNLAKGIEPKTDESRLRTTNAMNCAAALLHQHVDMEFAGRDEKASNEQCVLFHTFRQERVCAPQNYRTMMRNLSAECRNIARAWDDIEPPAGFNPSQAKYRN
ncbi:hypothetical protein [Mesorhizobium caraganae]|uniref:hypothetical protein n=1 Tax=Mesorhizobium caraganae TaxID=483206 RepID=UPI00177D3034|nr:hypothetical protein [Mesorhizobium caraganae]